MAEELAAAFGVKTIPLCMDLARSEAPGNCTIIAKEKLQIGILHEQCRYFLFDDLTEVTPERSRDDASAAHPDRDAAVPLFRRGDETPPCGVYPEYVIVVGLDWPGISVYAASKSYIRSFRRCCALRTASIRGQRDDRMSQCDSDGISQR